MNAIQGVFAEYVKARSRGVSQQTALDALRHEIEPLSKAAKREFITVMRAWEKELNVQARQKLTTVEAKTVTHQLEPLAVLDPVTPEMVARHKRLTQAMPVISLDMLQTQEEDTISQGKPEHQNGTHASTEAEAETAEPRMKRGSPLFEQSSMLCLRVKSTGTRFELRPQDNDELFLGRSALRGALAPDVDLASCNGARLGVSQLHMSIEYDRKEQTLKVYDLNSTNGSFINGEQVYPDEPRTLHDGDHLRLGLLSLGVEFKQKVGSIERIS